MAIGIHEILRSIETTAVTAERDLDRRLERLQSATATTGGVRDRLEREFDELTDEPTRRRLRQRLAELDTLLEDIVREAQNVGAHDLFDPLRVLSADLRLDAEPRALWPSLSPASGGL